MKNLVLFVVAFVVFNPGIFAQNNVELNILHKLGEDDFAFNMGAKNNLGNDFNVTRLEYYISEISLIHDSGMETTVKDLWILVDASETTTVDLGDYSFDEVEGIKFHIGVDPDHNHTDPSSYSWDHPLAPQFPSMHWGWAAGYRFIAYEGNGGSNYNQLFQLHGLGDDNYFTTEINVSAKAENNQIVINLNADYSSALENIAVNSGVIVHGDYGDAKKALENFNNFVFSPAETTSTLDFSEVNRFEVYPNPSTDGTTTVVLNADGNLIYQISVVDILGREIKRINSLNSNSSVDLNFDNAGIYMLNLIKENQSVITKKLMVK